MPENTSSALPPDLIPYKVSAPNGAPLTVCREFAKIMQKRRSVRDFSTQPVPRAIVESIIATAATAPSGANKQPWTFVAVQNPSLKREIRIAAEKEEHEFYTRRAPKRWLEDLQQLGTNEHKPFLEDAPWLIVIFKKIRADDGGQMYYVDESVGIAVGMLLTAAHLAGLATLTHTPSPMKFLTKILNRPTNERPFLLIPIGYPAANCRVPAISRKALTDVLIFND